MSWLLMGLLAVFLENGVRSHALSLLKSASGKSIVTGNTASNLAQKESTTSMTHKSVTTTRSVTVHKKSTVFKKKCWSDFKNEKDVSINSLEMCMKHGYNVDGLYNIPEFLNLLRSLNREQAYLASKIIYPRDNSLLVKNDQVYDVIIVGCGAAGSALTSLLSDEKDLNVLVLEAGYTPTTESEIPGLWANSIGSEIDWGYKAKEDITFGQSLDDKNVRVVRAKCLGGTTVLNTMLYDRGTEFDYLKFKEKGLKKWTWDILLGYYKRSEDCKYEKITTHETVSTYHSQGGKLCVDSFRNKKTVEIRKVYTKALKTLNYNTVDCFDVKNHKGFTSCVATIKNGLRVNAAKAFLKNADKKYNVRIAARSIVDKIIFDGKKAVGVEFENSIGERIRVKSKSKVIVSAGPVGSPSLLLQSGIGPKNLLDSLNIPVVIENKNVGSNLHAHPLFLGFVVKFEKEAIKPYTISEMVFEYLMNHTGPLATIGLGSFTGFIDIDGNGSPDVQLLNYYYCQDDSVFMPPQLDAFNFNDNITDQFIELNEKSDIQIIGISLLHPKNTGKVYIEKSCEGFKPVIEYGSLDDSDVDTLLKAIRWVENLMKSVAFKQYGPSIFPLKFEGGPEPNVDCDKYWKYAISQLTTMNIQMTGTSSMATEISTGVIDEDLSVFGATNLMVVDSSSLPIMFSAESSASSIMVAEKASDIIKEQLGLLYEEEESSSSSSSE